MSMNYSYINYSKKMSAFHFMEVFITVIHSIEYGHKFLSPRVSNYLFKLLSDPIHYVFSE